MTVPLSMSGMHSSLHIRYSSSCVLISTVGTISSLRPALEAMDFLVLMHIAVSVFSVISMTGRLVWVDSETVSILSMVDVV
mmetsp:Transcript_4386/g.6808  ORF Transcript_4386/g.6808 Transcript_4386/m.6808 type:complete len:81 (+) Transcript_4386:429-671(+)